MVPMTAVSCGLEVRVSLLYQRVVEGAWRLPPSSKIRGKGGKIALWWLLYRKLSRALVDRPKQGFGIPPASRLRGPLWPRAKELAVA